ncbi:transmembrane protein 26-like [Archocentrus centrarchus]|uniref:transmembrane protein 26-like n=1 Tax=Archocentrus centrarchus TaxID=63155 RepID=UPI0011EA26E3|nr:transmembrane protein 26-like [Archocentrus centrarchus]
MGPIKFICAIVTRALFILVALCGVLRVTQVKKDHLCWLLAFLLLPLVVEMIITLRRRKGQDYKWFSPPIFLFLISIIPSMWFLELHHQQNKNNMIQCKKLDSLGLLNRSNAQGNITIQDFLKSIDEVWSNVCLNDWILALHQILLILLIVGKWILPLGGGVTRDELSQLLLIFVGTAADILEFTSETLLVIENKNDVLVYVILGVWTWSMLQFPLHLSVVNTKPDREADPGVREDSLLTKHSTDIWNIVQALFIQDGPFLIVRLSVMTYLKVFHQMLVFFSIKNFLVVVLNLYRFVIICQDFRTSIGNNARGIP